MFRKLALVLGTAACLILGGEGFAADKLAQEFRQPPASARPWVYWFWLNGNITRAGITADLEAMQRAGIGGVLIMDSSSTLLPWHYDSFPLLQHGRNALL